MIGGWRHAAGRGRLSVLQMCCMVSPGSEKCFNWYVRVGYLRQIRVRLLIGSIK